MTHSLFCFASLVGEHDDEEELYLMPGSKTSHVTGSVVSSLFHLKDQSCFVFPDLSVRTEGRWRFKMSMYEIVEDGVHFVSSLFTAPFQCYSSKRFPGMSGKLESPSPGQADGAATMDGTEMLTQLLSSPLILLANCSSVCRIDRAVESVRLARPPPPDPPPKQVSSQHPPAKLPGPRLRRSGRVRSPPPQPR